MSGTDRLVINHLIPTDDPEISDIDWIDAARKTWSGPLTVDRDGLTVPIKPQKTTEGEPA